MSDSRPDPSTDQRARPNRTANWLAGAAAALAVGALIAWAGSHRGQEAGGIRLFLLFVVVAYLVQWAVFIPSYLARTGKQIRQWVSDTPLP